MRAIVAFVAGAGRYALDVADTASVIELGELMPLPDAVPEVAGLVRVGDESLPLLTTLSAAGTQAIVVRHRARSFAVCVDEVSGVRRVEDDAVASAPAGQEDPLAAAVLPDGALLLDASALERRLHRLEQSEHST